MDVRELLFTLGALLVLGILIDGLRRVILQRNNRLRVRLEPLPDGLIEPSNPELVSHVRVVERTLPVMVSVEPPSEVVSVSEESDLSRVLPPVTEAKAEPALVVDDLPLPVLQPEEAQESCRGEQQDMFADTEPLQPPPRRAKARLAESAREAQADITLVADHPESLVASESARRVARQDSPVDLVVMHVWPAQRAFQGEALLRAILSYGLRFGEMNIFHRHQHPTGRGDILFSMANAVEPGNFDLDALPDEECHGVTFFLSMPGTNSILAFDVMLDTARRLAQELGGQVLDQQHMPLTAQLAEHYRERVLEFERRRLMQRNSAAQ